MPELRRLLLQWFRYIILPKAGISIDFSENTTLEGAVAMYAEAFNTWKEKFRAECMVEGKVAGIAEGKAAGRAEGRAEGIAGAKLNSLKSCRKLYRTLWNVILRLCRPQPVRT